MPPTVQLRYSVAGFSEYSGLYTADNIMYDRPHDQASRWSSGKDNATLGPSWLLLEFETTCVLENVTFGKFHKVHPCNMKDFEIQIGMSRDYMTPVLHSTLKNDPKSETFPIRKKSKDGILLPTKFVKILALSAHGNNFNTSIWHISFSGKMEKKYIQKAVDDYDNNREALAMRHILKHLRQRRHLTSYRQLLARSGVQLEHPLVSDLYEALVLRGDWSHVELQLRNLARAGLFEDFILSCVPRVRWKRLRDSDANGDSPSKRGGHAMCMDVEQGLIYLFGGFDGRKSLDDFWVYNVREERWKFISHSSSVEEKTGPGPRACHKMIFDPKSGYIYLLGRLGDSDFQTSTENTSTSASSTRERPIWTEMQARRRSIGVGTSSVSGANTPVPSTQSETASNSTRSAITHDYFSELHRYRTRGFDQGKWELLNHDTGGIGGPKLIYDHQLALDSETQTLYVHGGRVVDGDWTTPKFSGMYSYDLRSGKWTNIQTSLSDSNFSPRFGHSMLLEPNEKKLFIFAGQKDDYLSDMWDFDIGTKTMTERFQNVSSEGGPESCFAQRAVIDPALQEIYVFAGLTKRNLRSSQSLSVSLLKYDSYPGVWMRVPVAEQHCPSHSHSHPATSSSQRSHHSLKRQRSEDDGIDDECDSGSDRDKSRQCVSDDDGEPVARSACQVVYDPISRTFYLFGGNAGLTRRDTVGSDAPEAEERLDDFWSMKLERPSRDEIIRRAIFETRTQQFKEMCEDASPVSALSFLQNNVSSVVNHADHDEAADFRSLLSHLFARPPAETPTTAVREPPMANSGIQVQASIPTSRMRDMAPTDPGTPVSDSGSSGTGSGSGEWTCELQSSSNMPPDEEDASMSDAPTQINVSRTKSSTSQPQAQRPRVGASFSATAAETGTDGPHAQTLRDKPPSDARFIQRTAVFEGLLRFVSAKGHRKQPDGLLVDLLSNLN